MIKLKFSYAPAWVLAAVGMWSGAALSVDALFIGPDGKVGVGTSLPSSEFEVFRTDISDILRLSNTGSVGFNLESRTTGVIWRFAGTPDSFRVSLDGTGGPEMMLNTDGSLDVGFGPHTKFFLDENGNLDITGTLEQASSKAVKDNIEPVDGVEVLGKVLELPIAEWSYTADESGARHLGPMAEDFSSAFGLGRDTRHLAPGDVAGVALAAVQALAGKLDEKQSEIERLSGQVSQLRTDYQAANERLRADNAALASRLVQLEGIVTTLAAQQPGTPSRQVSFAP